MGGLARTRLDAFIEATKTLAAAETRDEAAHAVIDSLAAFPDCGRASVLRPIGTDDYELIASVIGSGEPNPSQSLLREATRGNLVQLTTDNAPDTRSHSIIQMRVRSAVCVPIRVAGVTDFLLYIDTRGEEGAINADTIAFCDAISAVAGLAIERILAEEMADRQRQIELDLRSARDAQRMLFPPRQGMGERIEYVFESIPGRHVGGDLFDFFTLDDGRAVFFLGDAVGKGAGAGVLMVATQTLLRNLIETGHDLGEAVTRTNRGLAERSQADKFVTLMAGIWDARRKTLEMVDAGHGIALLDTGEGFRSVVVPGDIPLGINADTAYQSGPIEIGAACRLVLYSDGVAEQPDLTGAQFGTEGTLEALKGSGSSSEDIERIVAAVREHAAGDFSDDLTVASLSISAG